jgi:acyl-CoA thioesterase FadM
MAVASTFASAMWTISGAHGRNARTLTFREWWFMPFFAMQYQVLFHDTMAYGSHHHMANFKFQNIARETLLFETKVEQGTWREQLSDILILTREAYSLNLAPVGLGDKVAILLSYENPTLCTVRLCFRIIDSHGEPVSCGYQTMILLHKDTHEMVPAPPLLTHFLSSDRSLLEDLRDPSFAERTMAGSREIKNLFPEPIRHLGAKIASAPRDSSHPRIIDKSLREFSF